MLNEDVITGRLAAIELLLAQAFACGGLSECVNDVERSARAAEALREWAVITGRLTGLNEAQVEQVNEVASRVLNTMVDVLCGGAKRQENAQQEDPSGTKTQ